MRFQVCELLGRTVLLAVALLAREAAREELVWTVVVLGVPHDGLLGYTDHVARRDRTSIGEFEVFHDLALDGYYMVVNFFFGVRCYIVTATYKNPVDRDGLPHAENSPLTASACSDLSLGDST